MPVLIQVEFYSILVCQYLMSKFVLQVLLELGYLNDSDTCPFSCPLMTAGSSSSPVAPPEAALY